jgi:Zn-dependent protease with chaperone function
LSRVGALARVAAVPLSLTAACALIASATGGDPMLAVELAGVALIGGWLVHVGRGARPALAAAARLSAQSRRIAIAGVEVQLLDIAPPAAFVSGLLRPRIYVSPQLIAILDTQELHGVVLHEQHHRRTLAPLRGLALESWQRLLGRLPAARRTLAARLAALEIEADAAAVARGIAPAALASALLKCEAYLPAAASAFSAVAEIRIGALVAWGGEQRADHHVSVPVEWAAPASIMIALWLCHLVGA